MGRNGRKTDHDGESKQMAGKNQTKGSAVQTEPLA